MRLAYLQMLHASAMAAALTVTAAISPSPSPAGEEFYQGWKSDTIKMMAFEGCMFDYGFDMKESATERNRYWKLLGSRVKEEMEEELSSKEGWKDKYNNAISKMTKVCHEAAKRIDPNIFRIDYTRGGRHGWKTAAVVDIAHRDCLESDPMLTKSKIDDLQINSGANPFDMKNIELREKRTKGTLLIMDIRRSIKELGAGSDKCKKLLAGLSHNKRQVTKPSQVAPADEQRSAHKECLDAKDYEGCMRFNSGTKQQTTSADKCLENICIVTSKDADIYGLPKPMGWHYLQADDGRLFYFSRSYRIPHNGQNSRYVGMKRITRYYQSPRGGTTGSIIGGTSSSTSCFGSGESFNCTTTGKSPTYIPGSSPTPGGVSSTSFTTVYDCKEDTFASYRNGELWGGWKDGKATKEYFARVLRITCEKGESHVKELPVLDLKM